MADRPVTSLYAEPTNVSLGNVSLPGTFSLHDIPPENVMAIAVYSVLFVVSACGNLTVFITLYRNRRKRSRVSLFIIHLCLADLWVTFIFMPLEIAWHATISWEAGDAMCRLMMLFRVFGFYLSSFILVSISVDRYLAVARPLSITDSEFRGRIMLGTSWVTSLVASIPQVGAPQPGSSLCVTCR